MKKIIKKYCLFILVLIFFVIQSCAEDEIVIPSPDTNILLVPQQYSSIQSAINASNKNDTIIVAPGTYYENINFSGKNIIVKSSGSPENTIIDGSQPIDPNYASVVRITTAEDSISATLDGFTIKGGIGSLVNGKVIGGGIWINNAQAIIKNCFIQNNTANIGGGIYIGYDENHQDLNNCIITSSLIVNNYAVLGSAGLCVDSSADLSIDHCTFAFNTSSINRFAKTRFLSNKLSSSHISNTIIWEGQVDLYTEMSINYCDIKGGWSNGIGNIGEDPIFCDAQQGNFQLAYNSPCIGAGENGSNIGALGPCGQVNNILLVPQQYFSIQSAINAANEGDIVLVSSGTYYENINFIGKKILVISNGSQESTIIDGSRPTDPNKASVVTFNSGESEFSILDGFTITGGAGSMTYLGKLGGGIYIENSKPTIKNCIIRNNKAGRGGGIACEYYYDHQMLNTGVIINCIIAFNAATDYEYTYGGGIYTYGWGNINVNYCTITQNSAYDGSNLALLGRAVALSSIKNTIIWSGTLDINGSCKINYCDIQGGWATGVGNINSDPMFCNALLGNFNLTANSPCIGAGENGTNIGALGTCGQEYSRFAYPLEIGTTWKYSYSYYSSHMGEWWYRRGIHFWTVVDSTSLSSDIVRFSIKSVNYDSTASNYNPTVRHIIDSLIFYIDAGVDVVVVRPPSYVTGIEDNIQGYFSGNDSIKIGGRTYTEQIGLTNMLHENLTNSFYREKQQLIEFNKKRK